MIVTKRDVRTENADSAAVSGGTRTTMEPSDATRDENGMTRDDIFDQLANEKVVVTSGRGSRLPVTDSDGGTAPSGYSAGISSGTGSD